MKQGLTLFILLLLAYVLFSGKLRAVINAITGSNTRPALPPEMGSAGQTAGGGLGARLRGKMQGGVWDL